MSDTHYSETRLQALDLRHAALSAQASGLLAAIGPAQQRQQFARSETLRGAAEARVELDQRAHPSAWIARLADAHQQGTHCVAALQAAREALQAAQELQGLTEAHVALNAELAPLSRLLKRCREYAGLSQGIALTVTASR